MGRVSFWHEIDPLKWTCLPLSPTMPIQIRARILGLRHRWAKGKLAPTFPYPKSAKMSFDPLMWLDTDRAA